MESQGEPLETCACELACPCNLFFDHGARYDFCRVTLVFDLRAGEIEDIVPFGVEIGAPIRFSGMFLPSGLSTSEFSWAG